MKDTTRVGRESLCNPKKAWPRWPRRSSVGRRGPVPGEPDNLSPRRARPSFRPQQVGQLEELRSGLHKDEEARYWQANLLFERVSAQAGHPCIAWAVGVGASSELRPKGF